MNKIFYLLFCLSIASSVFMIFFGTVEKINFVLAYVQNIVFAVVLFILNIIQTNQHARIANFLGSEIEFQKSRLKL